jgi:hypothetical protein
VYEKSPIIGEEDKESAIGKDATQYQGRYANQIKRYGEE